MFLFCQSIWSSALLLTLFWQHGDAFTAPNLHFKRPVINVFILMFASVREASDTFYTLSRVFAINREDLVWAVLKWDPSGALGIFILTISALTLSQISLGIWVHLRDTVFSAVSIPARKPALSATIQTETGNKYAFTQPDCVFQEGGSYTPALHECYSISEHHSALKMPLFYSLFSFSPSPLPLSLFPLCFSHESHLITFYYKCFYLLYAQRRGSHAKAYGVYSPHSNVDESIIANEGLCACSSV